MSEYRFDPFHGQWVTIAQIRGDRPHEYRQIESREPGAVCPFCQGNESQTPAPVLELTAKDLPRTRPRDVDDRWLVRVVPNKFPALVPVESESRQELEPYSQKSVGGFQEIVIESPRHVASLSELTPDETFLTLRAVQQRILAAKADPLIRHVSVFKNCRPEAGALLEHAHSQLIFSRFANDQIRHRWQRCEDYYQVRRVPLLPRMVEFELDDARRVVSSGSSFAAICPFASRFAFQVWLMPLRPMDEFDAIGEELLTELASLVQESVRRLERWLNDPPYNLLFHLPPLHLTDCRCREAHTWFIEIVPRLVRLAGFEIMGSGWINETPPELAAGHLRDVELG